MNRSWRRLRLILLLILAALPSGVGAAPCASCGGPLGHEYYNMTDRVSGEKRAVCLTCEKDFPVCFLCGLPVKLINPGTRQLADGRVLCSREAETAVFRDQEKLLRDVKEFLDRRFSRFLAFPETNVTIALVDRPTLLASARLAGNDSQGATVWGCTQTRRLGQSHHRISILEGLPLAYFQATCAHEYAHAWLNDNVSLARKRSFKKDAEEGFCELTSFLFMDALENQAQKAAILRNKYTQGQLQLFVDAERQYGLNDVLDWMKFGEDNQLDANEPGRIRRVNVPRPAAVPFTIPVAQEAPPPPQTIVFKGLLWRERKPLAIINDQTFGVGDVAKVRLGSSNVLVRCLEIRKDAVKIQLPGSGEEQELLLKRR